MIEFVMFFLGLLIAIIFCLFHFYKLLGKIKLAIAVYKKCFAVQCEKIEKSRKCMSDRKEFNRMKILVEKELTTEIFLMSELTLEIFASKVKIPANQLSKLFASAYRSNFNSLINSYRVAYALKLLDDDHCKHSIEQISKKCGFNSRATFYRAFKSNYNVTPTRYKQNKLLLSK